MSPKKTRQAAGLRPFHVPGLALLRGLPWRLVEPFLATGLPAGISEMLSSLAPLGGFLASGNAGSGQLKGNPG